MEVLAFFLILYLRVVKITANENCQPLAPASSQIESIKVLPSSKEALILNHFPITELDFPLSPNVPNVLPEIENGREKSEIFQDSVASAFPLSLTNSFLNFEGIPTESDLNPSITLQQSVRNSLPTFGSNSFSNDFSGARCMSKHFKALRDSIEAYANFISSSNSVFQLPMTIQIGDSVSKPFDSIIPFDSFASPNTFDELQPQPPCVQSIDAISPRYFNFTDSYPSCPQSMFPAFDFPRALKTCKSRLISQLSDLQAEYAPCLKSFDTLNPEKSRLAFDSSQYSRSMSPLLDFPRNIETSQSPLASSSQTLLPVCDLPIETGKFSLLSQCTSPKNALPSVSCLSTVNLSPNFVNFDSFPSISSSSALSLPITVSCIDCNSCSLCPLPPHSPTFSVLPVQDIIEDCMVSTPNTVDQPVLPMSSPCSLCSSPLTVSTYSPPVLDSFLTDDLISNECLKEPTPSLSLSTDPGSCMISVKNLLPSLKGAKSISNSLSPVPLSSSLPNLPLKTTSFPLLPKPPISLFNNSFFEIPDLSNRLSVFDNTFFESLATPISSTLISPDLPLHPTSIPTLTPLITPCFSLMTPSSVISIPSSLSSNCISPTTIDLPVCEPNRCNIYGSSIISDQTALDTFSPGPFSNFFDILPKKESLPQPSDFLLDRPSQVLKNNDKADCSFLNDILSVFCR